MQRRKHLRLREYDYSTPGAYFITFCTHGRRNTLSRIVGAIHESPETELTGYGQVVDRVINSIPQHLNATVDRYVIMPNHVHLIVLINEEQRAIHESPLHTRSVISKTVGYIKMKASKQIHAGFGGEEIWQRGYYDHVIRNRSDYEMIAKYIYENPIRWERDKLYSEA